MGAQLGSAGVAACLADLFTFPLDTLKVRWLKPYSCSNLDIYVIDYDLNVLIPFEGGFIWRVYMGSS